MLDKEKIIEKIAAAIWDADYRKGSTWHELLYLGSQSEAFPHAARTVEITKKQAKAALDTICKTLPAMEIEVKSNLASNKENSNENVIKATKLVIYSELIAWGRK